MALVARRRDGAEAEGAEIHAVEGVPETVLRAPRPGPLGLGEGPRVPVLPVRRPRRGAGRLPGRGLALGEATLGVQQPQVQADPRPISVLTGHGLPGGGDGIDAAWIASGAVDRLGKVDLGVGPAHGPEVEQAHEFGAARHPVRGVEVEVTGGIAHQHQRREGLPQLGRQLRSRHAQSGALHPVHRARAEGRALAVEAAEDGARGRELVGAQAKGPGVSLAHVVEHQRGACIRVNPRGDEAEVEAKHGALAIGAGGLVVDLDEATLEAGVATAIHVHPGVGAHQIEGSELGA